MCLLSYIPGSTPQVKGPSVGEEEGTTAYLLKETKKYSSVHKKPTMPMLAIHEDKQSLFPSKII